MTRSCLSIVLAAGEGTRMKSDRPKVLHEVAHLPMVAHVVDAAAAAGGDHIALVVGRGGDAVEKAARARFSEISVHPQHERLGTAHAVLAAADAIERGFDDVLVLFGDATLIGPDTLRAARRELAGGASVCVVGFRTTRPQGLGRLLMEEEELTAIREEKDASEAERAIDLCNGGIMAIDGARALELLRRVGHSNAKGEYYLTDIVELARAEGGRVRVVIAEENELLGVNNRAELARAEAIWQARRRERLMVAGVTMVAPETVFLAHDTMIEADVTIEPNVVFGPGVRIAAGATIHAFCHIEGAAVAAGASIGPFARLRPGARIEDGAKVGNFCEVKNAEIQAGAKINHLSYVGDATVGAGANLGAGTITCNYDGFSKHWTTIGAGAFVGSNAALVAPVSIGAKAYVGSGSTVTDDVPDGALAIGRARQVTKEGRGIELATRLAAEKAARSPKP